MPFGQVVIGPPGSGKSTYVHGASQFLGAIGRKASIINLDPANDALPYKADVSITDLISLAEIQQNEGLGPNGGIIHAIETLVENFDWLKHEIEGLQGDEKQGEYLLIDLPGQVELFTHNDALRTLLCMLEKQCGYRLVVVHLVDAHYCTDPAKYISVLMVSLRAMLQLDLPHLNVLSKIDMLDKYGGGLAFNLDYYTEVQDLSYLLRLLEQDPRMQKFAKLNQAICSMIEDFGLVGFETLAVEDRRSMAKLLQQIDKAGGYSSGGAEAGGDAVWTQAVRGGWQSVGNTALDDQERWMTDKDVYERHEEAGWQRDV
ncbi:GPN-loop GTPase [Protomyces lactucae-debilis]|uniref:GPN-loop GTPase 2 n=1 Tax=Protomyces lactucae-debilis TaxID=2754530 RepID=A0A1Y2FA79_PROLT|nr:GPN-loop GTPase [Protomyces lactucae-debilis]ORY80818.1 GPN-loop GTPase [Protomyces lactucae-debilis]